MDGLLTAATRGALTLLQTAQAVFLSPGSMFSAASLLSALAVAVASLAWTRRRKRPLKMRVP